MNEKKHSKITAFALALCILISLFFCFIPSVGAESKQSNEILYNDNAYADYMGEENIYEYSFSYASKSVKEYRMNSVPYYFNRNNFLSNTCANVVGTEVLAYYSVYSNTMDGYVAGQFINDLAWYYSVGNSPKIQNTINELYTRMGTNSVLPGTSEAEFEKGMNSYCADRGLDIEYTNFVDSYKVNFNSIKTELQNKKVFVALLQDYNIIYNFSDKNNTVSCMKQDIKSNHMMLVFGYSDTYYYDSNGNLIKHLVALDVANGIDNSRSKVFLDNTANLIELKLIEISE